MSFSYAALATLKEGNDKSYEWYGKHFLLLLKVYALLYFTMLVAFQDSEVEFRYNTKATQNLYQNFLKSIRGLIISKTKPQLKIYLGLIEP